MAVRYQAMYPDGVNQVFAQADGVPVRACEISAGWSNGDTSVARNLLALMMTTAGNFPGDVPISDCCFYCRTVLRLLGDAAF